VGYQGRYERDADFLTRYSEGMVDVSGFHLFILNIRGESTFVAEMNSIQTILQSGNHLFSKIQKEE
jgi:hypothetical protein